MATVVMNSAMMPVDGTFIRRSISQSEFVSRLHNGDEIVSSIGYPATVQMIKRIAGITLPINRDLTKISADDLILVIKLKYRIDNPTRKKDWVPEDADYEYFLVRFRPEGYHEIRIAMMEYPFDDCFDLAIDNLPWFGGTEEKEILAHKVWELAGFPDLLNEYQEGIYYRFWSHSEFMDFMKKALRCEKIEA